MIPLGPARPKVAKKKSNPNPKIKLFCQVPVEGEKDGGVEWVADQAAITVQEIREVGKQEGRLYRMSKKSC